MPERNQALDIVRGAYAARENGDKEALGKFWSDDARFEIAGAQSLLRGFPLTARTPMEAIGALIDQFTFSDMELLDSVVEKTGEISKVAARWRVTITPRAESRKRPSYST